MTYLAPLLALVGAYFILGPLLALALETWWKNR